MTLREDRKNTATVGYTQTALFEHRFWLQILGDHARFIHMSLAPTEEKEIKRAKYFIEAFDWFLQQARSGVDGQELVSLNNHVYRLVIELREFKLHLLKRHLAESIDIHLPPSFINHMVNELEEYLRIMTHLVKGEVPPKKHPVHHHLLWLQDAFGHAALIQSSLDFAEKSLMHKSEAFAKQFEDFYLKAVEMAGYLRTQLTNFPALARFNKQVSLEMLLFKGFLRELEEMGLTKEVLGTLSPLMADHMAREECYYLHKLAEVSSVERPECDPAKPRTKG
jgi:hypothetical protein